MFAVETVEYDFSIMLGHPGKLHHLDFYVDIHSDKNEDTIEISIRGWIILI